MTSPKHARITADGKIHSLDSYQENYSYDPAIDQDDEAARKRMEAHNDRVTAELKRAGLI